jgi:hypothetical protein
MPPFFFAALTLNCVPVIFLTKSESNENDINVKPTFTPTKGRHQMLARFNNEVLSYGPTAVLPQNLTNDWIQKLQKMASDFLDSNFNLHECKDPRDVGDPVLMACVYEILSYQRGDHVDISPGDMAEKLTIYALAVIMEAVQRETDIGLEPPNLDNVLSIERIIAFKDTNPEFVNVLKQACIVKTSEKGWFRNIKKKLLSN